MLQSFSALFLYVKYQNDVLICLFLFFLFQTTTIINLAAPLYVFYHNRKTRMLQKIGVAEVRALVFIPVFASA